MLHDVSEEDFFKTLKPISAPVYTKSDVKNNGVEETDITVSNSEQLLDTEGRISGSLNVRLHALQSELYFSRQELSFLGALTRASVSALIADTQRLKIKILNNEIKTHKGTPNE